MVVVKYYNELQNILDAYLLAALITELNGSVALKHKQEFFLLIWQYKIKLVTEKKE